MPQQRKQVVQMVQSTFIQHTLSALCQSDGERIESGEWCTVFLLHGVTQLDFLVLCCQKL